MTAWARRTRILHDDLATWPVRAMRGLLDREPVADVGEEVPLGWHWLFFHEVVRAGGLGDDGHPRRGDFLPDVSRPRRMWAGGVLTSCAPLRLGEPAELRSVVTGVEEKSGRSGALTVVTVSHEVHQAGLAVEEEQILIYRDVDTGDAGRQTPASAAARAVPDPPPVDRWSEVYTPSRVTLFQFSALTWNAHRIHYDHPYVTGAEGYEDLLVHGPLTALLLLDGATRHGGPVRSFRYRALAPLYVERAITLAGRAVGGGDSEVEARRSDGVVAMRGWVRR